LKGPASLVWCLYPDCFAMDSKKVASLPPIAETWRPPEEGEVLEGDEMCSFVGCRKRKIWTWTVLCRRTGQVVACGVGDRSEETGRRLWEAIPEAYRGSYRYRDFWSAYRLVFSADRHQCVEKRTGQLAHIERWHNTVRPRLARYVRKSLSFSKSLYWHEWVTQWFVVTYNLELASSVTI